MTESWFDPVWIVLGAISLGALVTGIGLVIKAFSFHSEYLISSILGLVGTALFTAAGLLIPLKFLSGTTSLQEHLFADLMMYGISGLVVVAILCFIVDHLFERPSFLMLAAAACFAILIFPWIYLGAPQMFNEKFQITIGVPEPEKPKGIEPLAGERTPLEKVATKPNQSEQSDSPDASKAQVQGLGASNDEGSDNGSQGANKPDPSASQQASESQPGGLKKSGRDWLYDDP